MLLGLQRGENPHHPCGVRITRGGSGVLVSVNWEQPVEESDVAPVMRLPPFSLPYMAPALVSSALSSSLRLARLGVSLSFLFLPSCDSAALQLAPPLARIRSV